MGKAKKKRGPLTCCSSLVEIRGEEIRSDIINWLIIRNDSVFLKIYADDNKRKTQLSLGLGH